MKGTLIGAFQNLWRKRLVRIYEDTENAAMVYTAGTPLDNPTGTAVETHEPRADYAHYIGSFNKVYR